MVQPAIVEEKSPYVFMVIIGNVEQRFYTEGQIKEKNWGDVITQRKIQQWLDTKQPVGSLIELGQITIIKVLPITQLPKASFTIGEISKYHSVNHRRVKTTIAQINSKINEGYNLQLALTLLQTAETALNKVGEILLTAASQ